MAQSPTHADFDFYNRYLAPASSGANLCYVNGNATLNGDSPDNFFEDASCDGTADGRALLSRLSQFKANGDSFAIGPPNNIRQATYPTQHLYIPLSGSPLHEAGNVTICGSNQVMDRDIRQLPRGVESCDIGSVEATVGTIVVDNLGDEVADGLAACTLRDAILTSQLRAAGDASDSDKYIPQRAAETCGPSYDVNVIRLFATLTF